LASFEDATQRDYVHLLVDLNPTTAEEIRLRSETADKQIIVYLPVK
jgi:hypothetical protein